MQTWKHLTDIRSGSKHQTKSNWCICRLQLPVCSLWWFCVIHVDPISLWDGIQRVQRSIDQTATNQTKLCPNPRKQCKSIHPSVFLTTYISSLSFSFLHLPSSSSAERRNSHLWFCHVSTIFTLLFSFFHTLQALLSRWHWSFQRTLFTPL